MSEVRLADIVVVAVYMTGTLAIGTRFFAQSASSKGFTLGSGAIPSWAIGLSVLAVFTSSISFVGNPGKAFTDNWAPITFAVTVPLVAMLAGRYFVPLYRQRGYISAYALLEERLGYWARAYGCVAFLLIQVGRVSVILYLVSLVVAPTLGLSIPAIVLATAVVVTIYTVVGGIEAVIWTDVVQIIVMLAGVLWCLAEIAWLMPQGPAQMFAIAWQAGGKFQPGDLSWSFDQQTALGVFVFGILSNLQNFGIDQNYVQRYLTAGSDRAARHAVVLAAWPYVPLTALFLLIGSGLYSFYRVFPERLPAGLTGDMVFPHFIRAELPPGVSGLLVAAILAAAMSTLSSNLNCMATVFVEDLYARWRGKTIAEKEKVFVLRAMTAVWGVVGSAGALAMIGYRSGLDLFWQICATVGAGWLGVFLLAITRRRWRPAAVQWAVAVSILFVAWANLTPHLKFAPPHLRSSFDPLFAGAIGTILLLTLAQALSWVFSRLGRAVPGVEEAAK
jgi:SSS family solute:Na+ symporter